MYKYKIRLSINYFEALKKELFENLGIDTSENRTLLVGRAPHISRQAWLYPLLSGYAIIKLERELNTEIPKNYKWFLLNCSNGLGVFVSKFYLCGLWIELGRSIEVSRQPYSPTISNMDVSPDNARDLKK